MKVFITGARGFIGKDCLKAYSAIELTRSPVHDQTTFDLGRQTQFLKLMNHGDILLHTAN